MQSGRSPLCHHGPCCEHSNVACGTSWLTGGLDSEVRNESLGSCTWVCACPSATPALQCFVHP
eukprot:1680049-Alexandrium_andersonii.AAC.1